MIEYLVMFLAIPFGMLLAKLTKHEKNIYSNMIYFSTMLWILAILAAIFLTLDKTTGMSLLFTFLTTYVWFIQSKK